MRVLLLAEKCHPDKPSLPVVGYKACRALAEQAETVLVTHVRNREAIERAGMGGAQVIYVDNEYIARPMARLGKRLRRGNTLGWTTGAALAYPAYLAFEREVWKRLGPELKAGRFDVVHRVTPMSPTTPSPLACWSPVPFVLGPLNGGLAWPATFQDRRRAEREWFSYVRGAHRWLPYYRATFRRSAAILAGFEHTIRDIPSGNEARVIDFPEVGVDPALFAGADDRPLPQQPMQFLFVGRLVPYKCADLVIEAFAASDLLRRQRLRIVGDGPQRPELERLIHQHKLEGCVELTGPRSQAEVGRLMREADVLAFPSIRELGAGVVVEAMACGLACVVVDYGGPGGLIEADRGVKVPLGSPQQIVHDLTRQMESLVQQPERVRDLGQAARRFVLSEYTWQRKAEKCIQVYRWVTGQRPDKPAFLETAQAAGAAQ